MASSNTLEFQQSLGPDIVPGLTGLPGFWKLKPGRALSLRPRRPGVLRIARGRVWATFDGPHHGAANQLGDQFLQAGEQMEVKPGQRLVVEPLEHGGRNDVFFEWVPALEIANVPTGQHARGVTQPLQDLVLALGLVGTALVRLGAGLMAYVRHGVSGRPGVHPSHCS